MSIFDFTTEPRRLGSQELLIAELVGGALGIMVAVLLLIALF